MKNGHTIQGLATITNTARTTLINWIALGKVDAPKVQYDNIAHLRYDDASFQKAICQVSKCKPVKNIKAICKKFNDIAPVVPFGQYTMKVSAIVR